MIIGRNSIHATGLDLELVLSHQQPEEKIKRILNHLQIIIFLHRYKLNILTLKQRRDRNKVNNNIIIVSDV